MYFTANAKATRSNTVPWLCHLKPAEQGIHYSTHEALDSEGGQTTMTKSGRAKTEGG